MTRYPNDALRALIPSLVADIVEALVADGMSSAGAAARIGRELGCPRKRIYELCKEARS